jgi:Spy/CpxP family protein refolding chaperone
MQGARKTMFRAVIAFLLFVALPASAGEPQQPFKWWQGQQARELGLTGEQSTRIEAIHQAALPRVQTAMEDVEHAQQELSKLIAGDKTTEMDVVRQLNIVQAARSEVDRQMTLMLFRFYRELSPDQRLKVKALRDRWQHERRDRRSDPPQRPAQIKK